MNKSYTERFNWMLKEGGMIAAILLFWHAAAVLFSRGLGNIGMRSSTNIFTILGEQLANAAIQIGIASVVLYVLVRAGTYLIDYHGA